MNKKHTIALIAGGDSGEHEISLQSAEMVERHIDPDRYIVYKIIQKGTSWSHTSNGQQIEIDKNDFSLTINGEKITFDGVFIIVHGTPGEDGKLQGYFDLIGLKYTTCDAFISALTLNKSFCNAVVRQSNLALVAKSSLLSQAHPISAETILKDLSLPLFVKPNTGGSSVGMSKVNTAAELLPAIETAFKEKSEVLVEEFIEGREFSIGVFARNGETTPFPVTEIISKTAFFDYKAKYHGFSEELTPAPIDNAVKEHIQDIAVRLYRHLNCRGIVRFDFILHPQKGLFFLEVNTVPGQSEESIIPQQALAMGWTIRELYTHLMQETLGC